ncbi:hypothetical protein FRC07_008081, partial [Ceratobasidium sp. 392]
MSEADRAPPTGFLAGLGDSQEEAAQRVLEMLKRIEHRGGSAAFEKWLKETNNGTGVQPPPTDVRADSLLSESESSALSATASAPVAVYNIIEMRVTVNGANYFGSGDAWGPGVGYLNFYANLHLKQEGNIGNLVSNVSKFWFAAGGGVPGPGLAIIRFYDQVGNEIATAVGTGPGFVTAIGFKGEFELV